MRCWGAVVGMVALGCVAEGGESELVEDAGPPDGRPRGQDPLPYFDAVVPPCGKLAAVPPLESGSGAWTSTGDVGAGPFTVSAIDGSDATFTTVGDYDAGVGRLEVEFTITEIVNGAFALMLDDRAGHGLAIVVRDTTVSVDELEGGAWQPRSVRVATVRAGTFHVEYDHSFGLMLGLDDGSASPFERRFDAPGWLATTRVAIGGIGGAVQGSVDAIRGSGPGGERCPASGRDAAP